MERRRPDARRRRSRERVIDQQVPRLSTNRPLRATAPGAGWRMYLWLAAFWRGDAEEGARRLRLAARLEPPAAFAGQSASLLALHLAYAGRADDAVEVVGSLRPAFPWPDGSTPWARGTRCSAAWRRSPSRVGATRPPSCIPW